MTPYDTTELSTAVGEELDVIVDDNLSGWLWCRSSPGAEGWVPQNTVTDL
ncbi:MAG TPA: SH3 domain-containing protein [Acidothermaceae bacterium]|nr:SH3 domain-containing protein [Acidothermaceae bacterium]